jgi:hypothetical protein
MSSGRPGLRRRQNGATAVEAQENLLSHPMVRIQGRILIRAFIHLVRLNRRTGWMSVCSDGAVAPGAGQVRGQVRYPGVEMSAELLRRRFRMRRTRGIMTTFSVFCARDDGGQAQFPIARGHEVNRALLRRPAEAQKCCGRSWSCWGSGAIAPACLRSQGSPRRERRASFYLIG